MKLSVVIPTFNRRESLRRTLDGLARQTYPEDLFEVIVVSDGSTDGTAEMLAEYARVTPYTLRPITQPNSGPSVARNRGFREARHEIVVFLDDDVEPVPDFLHCHARHHAEHPEREFLSVLGPMSPDPVRAAEEPVWIAWEHAKLQQTYALFRPGGPFGDGWGAPSHFYSGNVSLRRHWLELSGGFDESFKRQEDVELAVRMHRDFRVVFLFDFEADGVHRPTRTFQSWLRIPQSYGALDAERVRTGLLPLADVENAARQRNRVTRALTSFCLAAPWLLPLVIAGLHTVAVALHRARRTGPALAVLSALYNACYAVALRRGLAAHSEKTRPLAEAKASLK